MGFWYLFLAGVVVAWARVELRHASTSRGIASLLLGCLMFSFGLVGAVPYDKVYGWLAIATGLFMALFGVARLVVAQVQNSS